jgi:sec-independent protein translocase protein TatC
MGLVELLLSLVGVLGGAVLLMALLRMGRRSEPPATTGTPLALWPLLATLFGGGLGFAVGAALGYALLLPRLLDELYAVDPAPMIGAGALAATTLRVVLACGLAGALPLALAPVAGSSARAMKRALLATALMPGFALALAALLTPPDVLTQLVVAAAFGLLWLLGIGLGGVGLWARRRTLAPRPPLPTDHE